MKSNSTSVNDFKTTVDDVEYKTFTSDDINTLSDNNNNGTIVCKDVELALDKRDNLNMNRTKLYKMKKCFTISLKIMQYIRYVSLILFWILSIINYILIESLNKDIIWFDSCYNNQLNFNIFNNETFNPTLIDSFWLITTILHGLLFRNLFGTKFIVSDPVYYFTKYVYIHMKSIKFAVISFIFTWIFFAILVIMYKLLYNQ